MTGPTEPANPAPKRHVPADTQRRGGPAGLVAWLLRDAEQVGDLLPDSLKLRNPENRIPVAVAIVTAVVLQYRIPNRFGLHPRWLIPTLELILLAVLVALNPTRLTRSTQLGKYASLALVAAITLDNCFSAGFLDNDILTGKASDNATGLLASGAAIYLTNVIAFGIWYWELDSGGPFARFKGADFHPDFMFPQMANPNLAPPNWRPHFVDYLYVSFTNVAAFSPTDTMPLSRWAKSLMALQSVIALSMTALVIARAVNVLK